MELLIEALILICWINFFSACFWEGMIFEKLGGWLELHMHWLWKPSIGCIVCMAPWHGILYCIIFDVSPFTVVIAAGVNAIIVRFDRD